MESSSCGYGAGLARGRCRSLKARVRQREEEVADLSQPEVKDAVKSSVQF